MSMASVIWINIFPPMIEYQQHASHDLWQQAYIFTTIITAVYIFDPMRKLTRNMITAGSHKPSGTFLSY